MQEISLPFIKSTIFFSLDALLGYGNILMNKTVPAIEKLTFHLGKRHKQMILKTMCDNGSQRVVYRPASLAFPGNLDLQILFALQTY